MKNWDRHGRFRGLLLVIVASLALWGCAPGAPTVALDDDAQAARHGLAADFRTAKPPDPTAKPPDPTANPPTTVVSPRRRPASSLPL